MILNQSQLDEFAQMFDRSSDDLTLSPWSADGRVRLEYKIEDQVVGVFQVLLTDSEVEFEILNFVPAYRSSGFYLHAVKVLPDWFRELELFAWKIPTLAQRGSDFHKSIVDTGWEENESPFVFSTNVADAQSSRLDQYNAWVYDSADEPQWHAELPEDFRVTTEPAE
jgi:hypothetical protein